VIRALADSGRKVRALVFRPHQEEVAKDAGAQEVHWGDMRNPTTLERAVRDARALYHICPNVNPHEVTMGQTAISAALRAGVDHFVYHSVLHPQTQAMPHHWLKMRVEEHLLQSGLPFTIVQPAAYMQNVLAHWDRIQQEGAFPIPYHANTRLSMVDLEDVAAAAAVIFRESGHEGATYELVGTEPMSQHEVAAILGQELGRQVRAVAVPLRSWEKQARTAGLGEYQIDALLKMFRYYGLHGFSGSPQVLRWLLGRTPNTLGTCIRRRMQDFAAATAGEEQS
jgi:uncharacterized protein YbjT (DUF2867 family)